jgi:hypothetical protein
VHDEWMSIVKPDLHPAVSAQLHEKFDVSKVEMENSKSVRSEMRVAVNSLLKVIIFFYSSPIYLWAVFGNTNKLAYKLVLIY